MKVNTYTVPSNQKANVVERCNSLDFYIPQGIQGEPGTPGGGIPLNFFDGTLATLTTAINQVIICPTSITHQTNNGIMYNDKTGVVTISTGWWFIQYGFTMNSVSAQTATTYVTQGGVAIDTSKMIQPLLANQPQTVSRTLVISASTDFNLTLVCQSPGIQLSQVNWFVKMIEA